MQVGNVQKLISIFDQSFRELNVTVSMDKLEALSVMIHRAMTVQARHFHTLEHVFNFVDPNNPIVSLAALYHDIVYYQVDMGFSPPIGKIVAPYIRQVNDDFYLLDQIDPADHLFFLTMDIFGLHPGQKLSSVKAFNEFLSALVMNKQLGGLVTDKDLLLMTMCIEATIPFRGFSADGKNHFDLMEFRLPGVIQRYGLDINSKGLIDGIKTAVLFANKDIENFGETNSVRFLENTWKLLPETNVALRMPEVYTMGAYREALQKMKAFFDGLNAETVFSQYRGIPSTEEYLHKTRLARNNIEVARQYLGIKILGTLILEALARATGGDAPLSLFLGDKPKEGVNSRRLEYYLPDVENSSWVDQKSIIYQLLESGQTSESAFDMINSLLDQYIYKSIPPDQINIHLWEAQDLYDEKISPEEFLKLIDPQVVTSIARASAKMVFTRQPALQKFAGVD